MSLIIKIAWRNILRHKGKSLIIGIILFVGALVMTVGNGVISGMDRGLSENIVKCFTGDAVIISDKQQTDNVFLEMMGKAVEPVYNAVDIKKVIDKQDYVLKSLPVGKNMVLMLNEEGGSMGDGLLLGVDFEKYSKIFPENVKPVEGRLPYPGENGALLPTGARKQGYDYMNIWFIPESETLHVANLTPEAKQNMKDLCIKNNLVLMGFNDDNSTSDIRLGIKGVIKYKALNHVWGHFIIIDIESFRHCMGYFSASEKTGILPPEQKALFDMNNDKLDDMFSDQSLIVKNTGMGKLPEHIARSTDSLSAGVDIDAGAYNMILTFFKPGISPELAIKRLNNALKNENLGVHAISWKKSIGPLGNMATLIKAALFGFVMFLFFVAIIIIVNTLSMAAIERTSEIGMMRAVGARKSFIRRMFLGETAILSAVFGGIGIITGIIAVKVLELCRITSDNDMIQLLFGGDTFRPFLSVPDIGMAVFQLAVVTALAVIYPVKIAGSITPLDAISRD
jgi:ABC-type lipoprotein release transport system permease subunit